MKIGKFFLAGILAAIIQYLINSIFGYTFRELYDPTTGLWRAMPTPSWIQNVILANIIIAFLIVTAYAAVNTGLGKKAETTKKGLKFGLIVWLVKDITGGIMTYVFMPVPLKLISTWIIASFIINLVNGIVIAKIYK